MTSAVAASFLKISWPSADFMLRAIERLLRLVKAWIVRRTQSGPLGRSGSGVSIFRTSAPMSASIIPGISAGGTRASSRILIPSSTPMRFAPPSGDAGSVQVAGEARGQSADVGNVLEMLELRGDPLGLVARERTGRAGEELGVERLGGERRVGVALRAARRRGERPPVGEAQRHARPRVLLEAVRQRRIHAHRDALH